MLQGREFALPRSPRAVSWETDPPPSQAEPCLGCSMCSTAPDRSKKQLPPPGSSIGSPIPACVGCRSSRMPGYHWGVHEIQTQGHRCTNPMMEKCPFGEVWDKEFFFFKVVSRPEIPRGDPSSPAAEFNYGKSLQATLARKHSPACPLHTQRNP